MSPEEYMTIFMQAKPKKRSFPDQSQYDYEIDVLRCCDRCSIFKRALRFFTGIVK